MGHDNSDVTQGKSHEGLLSEKKAPSRDITPLLKGWDFEPGTINVRKIHGLDGSPKLQMRLDLGVLQMEMTGRPDGARPHGCESLLEYYESQLAQHQGRNGTELGFHLTSSECQQLREEAAMYYQRYLSMFVLGEFVAVVRDTSRNLRVLDLCGRYAVEEQDRMLLEQYRPYITMMNTRASASILFQDHDYPQALSVVVEGLERIRRFYDQFGQPDIFAQSSEVKVLKKLARDIRKKMPMDPKEKLQNALDKAVKTEHYEEAAKLRDQLKNLTDTQA